MTVFGRRRPASRMDSLPGDTRRADQVARTAPQLPGFSAVIGLPSKRDSNEVLTVISTGLARHLQRIERLAGTLAPRVDKHTGNVRS